MSHEPCWVVAGCGPGATLRHRAGPEANVSLASDMRDRAGLSNGLLVQQVSNIWQPDGGPAWDLAGLCQQQVMLFGTNLALLGWR